MKQLSTLCMSLCFLCLPGFFPAARAQSTPKPDTVILPLELTMEGISSGTAKLVGFYGDQNFLIDTALIGGDGKVIFKPKEPFPAGLYYVLFPGDKNVQLLIDKGQQVVLKTKTTDIIGNMQANTIDNQLLYKNLKFQLEIEPKFGEVGKRLEKAVRGTPEHQQAKAEQNKLLDERQNHINEFKKQYANTFFTKFKLAGQNPRVEDQLKPDGTIDTLRQVQLFREHFWDDVDFNDERLLRTPVFATKLNRFIKEMTAQQPDSIIAAADFITKKVIKNKELFKYTANWIALQHQPTKTTVMDGEAVFAHMILNYWKKDLAFWADSFEISRLRDNAEELVPSLLGKVGQNVTARDRYGNLRSLYDLKAPLLVVFIYNPDCEHCKEQTPKLIQVYQEWKDKGVDVFAIASMANYDQWYKFQDTYKIPWTDVIDPKLESKYHKKYHVDITPEIYVLNKDRIIIAKNLKADQLPISFEREFKKMKEGK